MAEAQGNKTIDAGQAFREKFVDADGFRIRYLEAGSGDPVLYLHGGGGLEITRAHELLSEQFRVIAFEMPGFGQSPENTRTQSMPQLAETMAQAGTQLGIESFNLMGTSFGGKAALWLAAQFPERVEALVLESPAAIRPESSRPPTGSPEEMARRLFAHPERVAHRPASDPDGRAKTRTLVSSLIGPGREPELERRMRELKLPVLVLFGTADSMIPPEMGHIYMDLLPNGHLMFIYDAGHEIGAERPEAFAEAVIDFLHRREAFVISRNDSVLYP
jgi:pimeloyl-ACP methyl ester carboxylesterase